MTFYQFSHFLQIWLFPPGVILLSMLVGFFLLRWKKQLGFSILAASFFIFWLLSTPIVTQYLIDNLQQRYQPLDLNLAVTSPHMAIVVLGSGIEEAKEYRNKQTVSDLTLSRLHYTAHVYKKMQLPVIVSGGNRDNLAATEAQLMKEVLQTDYAVPISFAEDKSKNTLEEAQLLLPILKNQGITTILLITHAWHMPRSVYAFENCLKQENIKVIPCPMGYTTIQSHDFLADCLPSLKALTGSFFALHEYVGLLWYYLRY